MIVGLGEVYHANERVLDSIVESLGGRWWGDRKRGPGAPIKSGSPARKDHRQFSDDESWRRSDQSFSEDEE